MTPFTLPSPENTYVTTAPKGRYRYETHCHTAVTSACATITPERLVELYVRNGYTGVFVTDHFLNGNCHPWIRETADWRERVRLYFAGYRQVRDAAAGRLQVFPGIEMTYAGTDVLVWGWDEEITARYPEMMELSYRELIRFVNEHGGLTAQAHPFREADYIDHIRLYPDTQGVEVFNACRNSLQNGLAYAYWQAYNDAAGKVRTAGSDTHHETIPRLGGMAFDTPLTSPSDFVERLKRGEGELFAQPNVLVNN